MPFVFSLRGPLRVREMQERAALQALQSISAQVDRTRAEIAEVDAAVEAARREVWAEAAAGLPASELHYHAVQEAALRERRRALVARLREREAARNQQQERYRQARQQRDVLVGLRDQQRAVYDLEQSRRAQRELDELFLMRRAARQDSPQSARQDSSNSPQE
jgi:flagellar export protein FliJ